MNKFVLAILAVGLLMSVAIAPAYAQARYGLQPADAAQTDTSLVLGPKTWLYKAVIYADDTTNVSAAIYDVTAFQDGSATNVVDEIGEATQYESTVHTYDPPIFLTYGASVTMATGVLILFSGPHPK